MKRLNFTQPVNRQHPLNRGLVSWWLNMPQRWSGGGFSFRDIAGQNHGTLQTLAGIKWVSPMQGSGGYGALDMNGGSSAHVVVPTHPSQDITEAITIIFTVKTLDTSAAPFGKWLNSPSSSRAYGVLVLTSAARFILNFSNSSSTLDSSTDINDDSVYRLAFTYDGADMKIYVNGVEDASKSQTGLIDTEPSLDITMGIRGGSAPYDGLLDDVKLYKTALSSAAIKSEYDDSLAGHPDTLNFQRRAYKAPAVAPTGDGFPFQRYYLGVA